MKDANIYGRGIAIGFVGVGSNSLDAVVNCRELGSFTPTSAAGPSIRESATEYMTRAINSWRKLFPNENLRIVEIDYSRCDDSLNLKNWKFW